MGASANTLDKSIKKDLRNKIVVINDSREGVSNKIIF